MRYCRFKHASTEKVLSGSWSPYRLEYLPFAEVDEFCNPCYRWRFLELIRGSFPRWGSLLRNPRNPDEEFPQFFRVSPNFNDFAVILLKALSRSTHPDGILRNLRQPAQLLDEIRGNVEIEEYHVIAMELVGRLLERLESSNVLKHYISTENTLFNLLIMNEELDIFRNDTSPVTLDTLRHAGIGINRQRPSQSFSWRGSISIYGNIPIINLENQEIRVPIPITDNCFDPPLNLSDTQNTPAGIRSFFISREFHKMWILRESLAQLIDDHKFRLDLQDVLGNPLFNSSVDLSSYDFRGFNIIIDTIEHSIPMDPNLSFKTQTGHAAIIYYLLYKPYPNLVNNFQDLDPCPIRIGQDPNVRYNCPLGRYQGCYMGDRRIENLQFPRDRIEKNVYKFLRLLRDELVFSHETLYKISRLHPDRLDELNFLSDFWIGEVYQDSTQRWIFRCNMPQYWNLPQVRDDVYEISLISPLIYEKGLKLRFSQQLNDTEFVITPNILMNPWTEYSPFNGDSPVPCIVSRLSVDEYNFNIRRQKRQLVRSVQFTSSKLTGLTPNQRTDEILRRRLANRGNRTGMATFGRFARYV